MSLADRFFGVFEGWIDPFKPREDYEPPNRLLAYVWFYVGPVKWAFLALLIYGFANAIVEAIVFSFVGQLVDILAAFEAGGSFSQGWEGLLAEYGWTLFYMVLIVALLRALIVTFGALIEEQVIVPGFFVMMRWQSHKHVIGQSLSFFHNDLAGRISQKVFQSGMATGDMMISLLQVIWFVVVYALTTAGALFALDWQLGGVIVLWIALFYILARYFVPKVRDHARITAETASGVSGRMVDGYANIQTVKLNAAQSHENDWVLDSMLVHQKAIFAFTRVLTLMRVSLSVANGFFITAIGWLATDLWLQGEASLGEVAFVMALTLRLHLLSNRLLGNLNGFFRNVGVTQNTMGLVAQPHGLKDEAQAPEFQFGKGEIIFDRVSFSYDRSQEVLNDVSVKIASGEKVGIVGHSGSGKTTFSQLLMRFYDVTSGKIFIDGQDIKTVQQDSLREQFSFVPQDVQMFHRSVAENIAYGRNEAGRDAIERAAKLADAHGFIVALEDKDGRKGYDARVGEKGVKLSGGQRQRIAIARALLKDAPILILDEATSQLDTETEERIQSQLLKQMDGKTVIVIAHRLSTVVRMDRILVMDKGAIVDEGTHHELVERNAIYNAFWSRQSGGKA